MLKDASNNMQIREAVQKKFNLSKLPSNSDIQEYRDTGSFPGYLQNRKKSSSQKKTITSIPKETATKIPDSELSQIDNSLDRQTESQVSDS